MASLTAKANCSSSKCSARDLELNLRKCLPDKTPYSFRRKVWVCHDPLCMFRTMSLA